MENMNELEKFITDYFRNHEDCDKDNADFAKLVNDCQNKVRAEKAIAAKREEEAKAKAKEQELWKEQKLWSVYELLAEAFEDVLDAEGIDYGENTIWDEFLKIKNLKEIVKLIDGTGEFFASFNLDTPNKKEKNNVKIGSNKNLDIDAIAKGVEDAQTTLNKFLRKMEF